MQDVGDPIPYSAAAVPFERTPAANDDFWDLKKKYFGTVFDRAAPNTADILGARSLVYHYTIVAAAVAGAPGWGELLGDDFINKKEADWDTDAAAFMHELGHNLGLSHGGPVSADAAAHALGRINYKPNQLSIMNYAYSYLDWATTRPLDYSRYSQADLLTLEEGNLLELQGVLVGKPWQVTFNPWRVVYSYNAAGTAQVATASLAGIIDWNHDGTRDLQTISANINDQPNKPATNTLETLQSLEEWNHLRYDFRSLRNFAGVVEPPRYGGVSNLPDWEYFREVARTLDTDGDGVNNADDNVPAVFNPDQLDTDGDGIGDAGELVSLALSHASVPDGTPSHGYRHATASRAGRRCSGTAIL